MGQLKAAFFKGMGALQAGQVSEVADLNSRNRTLKTKATTPPIRAAGTKKKCSTGTSTNSKAAPQAMLK
jgi:hypothetical protein